MPGGLVKSVVVALAVEPVEVRQSEEACVAANNQRGYSNLLLRLGASASTKSESQVFVKNESAAENRDRGSPGATGGTAWSAQGTAAVQAAERMGTNLVT